MENKTFDEFYLKKDPINRNRSVNELIDYYNYYKNIDKYKRKMFCPECKLAQLTFVKKNPNFKSFLRKIPSTDHFTKCSYCFEYGTTRTITKYISSLDDEKVKGKAQSMLRFLFRDNKVDYNSALLTNNPFLYKLENKSIDNYNYRAKNVLKKAIRRKKLDSWIDKDDKNLYVFYGKVKLAVEKRTSKNNYSYNLLLIHSEGKYKQTYYIYRGKIYDEIDESKTYKIVIIGKYSRDNEDKLWSQKINNSDKRMYGIELVNQNQYALIYEANIK